MLKLVIEDDEGRKTVVPFVREEITIGRQEGNTIRLTERNVSRRHARLMRNNGSVLVEDLGSYNGIRINGERIKGQVPVVDGDLIQIGDYDLAIQSDAAQAAPPPAPKEPDRDNEDTAPAGAKANGTAATAPHAAVTAPPAPAAGSPSASPSLPAAQYAEAAAPADDGGSIPISESDEPEEAAPEDVLSAPNVDADDDRRQPTSVIRVDQLEASRPRKAVDIDAAEAPRLVVLNTEHAGREFACIRSELRVGRVDDNDIAIDHRSLSRTHAKIVREDSGEWRVIDMQSANGLTVNGESYAKATLKSGDVVELGHVKLKFVGAGETFQFIPEVEAGAPGGKRVALLGGLVAVALVVGGGAVWMLKGGPTPAPEPAKPAPLAHVAAATPTNPTPAPRVEPPKPPAPAAGPTNAQKLADAKTAIESLDWEKAATLLESCKADTGAMIPEAQTLLTQLEAETELRRNLDEAEAALGEGRLEEANTFLNDSQHTKLLGARYSQLRVQWKAASDKRLAQRPVPTPKPPPAQRVAAAPKPPAVNPQQEAQKLYEEGLLLARSKQLKEARTTLEKCLKVDPTFALCHKALGGANAKLGDSEKGAYHYRKFIQLAPNDKDADKVRAILDTYEGTKH